MTKIRSKNKTDDVPSHKIELCDGDSVSGTSLEGIVRETAAEANLLLERAETGNEIRKVNDGNSERLASSKFFELALERVLKEFEISREGNRRARKFFEGKESIKFSIPKAEGEKLFGKDMLGEWSSYHSAGDQSQDRNETDSALIELRRINLGLVVQLAERDTAYVRAELQMPHTFHISFSLKMLATPTHFDFEWAFVPSGTDIPGLSIQKRKNQYRMQFNEEILDFSNLKDVPLERIGLILLKLDCIRSKIMTLMHAGIHGLVRLSIVDLIPYNLQHGISTFYPKDQAELISGTLKIVDEIEALADGLRYRQKAEKRNLPLRDGESLQDVFLPGSTVEALDTYGFDYKESFSRDGFTFFLLPVREDGPYYKCLFYVYDGKSLQTRLAYKSISHQRWRVDSADLHELFRGEFDKGVYSYEAETIPCVELDNLFMRMEGVTLRGGLETLYSVTSLDPEGNTYRSEIRKDLPIPGISEYYRFPLGEKEEVIQYLQEFLPTFLPDFTNDPLSVQKRFSNRFFPNGFVVEEFHFTFAGVELRIDVAHDEEGNVWIDRLEKINVPINSYGIKSKFLSFGFLDWKPFEYKNQISDRLKDLLDVPEGDDPVLKPYVKRTRILDLLPLIRHYREQRKVFRKNTNL